jgi:hypothetical protein
LQREHAVRAAGAVSGALELLIPGSAAERAAAMSRWVTLIAAETE